MSGHYHDPQGKYDFCDDTECPRVTVVTDDGAGFGGQDITYDLDRERWELEQERSQPTEEDLINWREADDYRDEGFDGQDYDDYE